MMNLQARAADAGIAQHGDAAINGLTALIAEAVRDANDQRVAELDRILRQIETIIELSRGSPRDRVAH